MSEEFEDKKRFINLVKRIKGGVFAMNVDNALFGMRNPKMVMTLVQPAPEDSNDKYLSAKFYLGVPDIVKISDSIMRQKPVSEQPVMLFQGYQGSYNNKKARMEARVMKITAKIVNRNGQKSVFYSFSIENCAGVQTQVKNGAGQSVPGVVKPATGADAQTFAKNSFGASRDEAIYIATMMKMELQAWRTAVNTEMLFYPNRYRLHGHNTASQPPTASASA